MSDKKVVKEVKKVVKEEVKEIKEIKPIKDSIPSGLRVDAPKIDVGVK